MVNPTGKNGRDNGTIPPDSVLKEALLQYARERLPVKKRLERLAKDYDFHINKTKLMELNTRFQVPSSRKPPPLPIAASLVCEKMDEDPTRGPTRVMNMLAMEGYAIPRSVVRSVMHANDPTGARRRQPRGKIPRKPLEPVLPSGPSTSSASAGTSTRRSSPTSDSRSRNVQSTMDATASAVAGSSQ